ncbi:MAG: chromosomal replication initiator protein DnaA [Treponema sp.]|jgi:chromosomal replication initiator protein|nr:chromosomal replication initiator protein DnaA [Treponema sp.]
MAEWDYELFWHETQNQIREELGEEEFSRWFRLIDYLGAVEYEITLGVPSAFYRDQVKSRYQNRIEAALKLIAGRDIGLLFKVVPRSQQAAPLPQVSAPLQTAGSENKSEPQKVQPNLFPSDPPLERSSKKGRHPLLREDYTFDKYVIGNNNDFAANAAIFISRNPGTVNNPFLIYGGVGLGKTHLMQAIGNYIHHNSDLKIIYITSENFINEFIQSLNEKRMSAFRNKYRFADMLLIDDIQFLEDKWGCQEELFHTFNALYDANKHIVFTCDRRASELKKISERLRSRFERGLNVDIQPPNYETRFAILKSKLQDRKTPISDEVLGMIAKNITTNVRDLEAALTKLIAYAELLGKPITLETAQQQLKYAFASPVGDQTSSDISIDAILQVVANYFSISPTDLKSKKRTQKIAQPRHIAMYIAREITEFTQTEIGQQVGGKDYGTVIHACKKIENQCLSDPTLESTIQTLVDMIKKSVNTR